MATRRGLVAVVVALGAAGCDADRHDPARGTMNATVVAVIDGDTLDVDIEGRRERVRLIGVDTPEIAHPAGNGSPATDAECFADAAHGFAGTLVPVGTPIRIERDVVGRDHYDRLLGYVHRRDGVFANFELVRQGYGRPMSIAPNQAYDALFVEAARAAERDDIGLWAACS